MVFPVHPSSLESSSPSQTTKEECSRNEIIQKLRGMLDVIETSAVEASCLCTDPKSPPEGVRVVKTACLDGKAGLTKSIPSKKGRIIWAPPPVDNRPLLDPSHSCYASTVCKGLYNSCDRSAQSISHSPPPPKGVGRSGETQVSTTETGTGGAVASRNQQNAPTKCCNPDYNKDHANVQQRSSNTSTVRDFCEDPTFVAPTPLGHQAWTNEPGGSCRFPEYCKAHCFEHSPSRDWARH